MAKLIFDGYAIINGSVVTEYTAKQNECINLCLFSPPSCLFYDDLIIKNNKIMTNSNLKILSWGNVFEIKAIQQNLSTPPLAVKQKSQLYQGREYLLTVYKDNNLKILLESEAEHLPYAPIVEISSPEISATEIDNCLLFTITASCVNGSYILILQAFPKLEKIFEEFGENIKITNTDITITKTIDDMLKRTLITEYAFKANSFTVQSREFSYTNEHMYIDELKPYLLLESIMAGDIEYAKSLLSEALANKAEYLFDFFGQIIDIDYPKYSTLSNDCVAVIGAENTVRYFKFDIKERLIANIIEL